MPLIWQEDEEKSLYYRIKLFSLNFRLLNDKY